METNQRPQDPKRAVVTLATLAGEATRAAFLDGGYDLWCVAADRCLKVVIAASAAGMSDWARSYDRTRSNARREAAAAFLQRS